MSFIRRSSIGLHTYWVRATCGAPSRTFDVKMWTHLLTFVSLTLLCWCVGSTSSTTLSTSDVPSTTVSSTQNFYGVGCDGACCQGRNNTCHSTGVRLNGKGASYSRCFCDDGCLRMGDCCFDYHSQCTAIDCEVSEWSSFSPCSKACGVGFKARKRAIVTQPHFGGKKCPHLKETKLCSGTDCPKTISDVEQSIEKETAKIIPARFGRYRSMRRYNANMDIRKNLFYQYYHKDTHKYSGYCSRFRVATSGYNCMSYLVPWANVFKQGTVVCVDCQQTAMEKEGNGVCVGHGEVGTRTHWNAVNARGCSGWWERLEDNEDCACDQAHSFIFI